MLAVFPMTLNGAKPEVIVNVSLKTWWPGVGLIGQGDAGGWYSVPLGVMTLDGRFCDRASEYFTNYGWWPAKRQLVVHGDYYAGDAGEITFDPITFARDHTSAPPKPPNFNHPLAGRNYVKLPDRSIFYGGSWIYGASAPCMRVVVDDIEVEPEGPGAPFSVGFLHPGRSETEVFLAEYAFRQPARGIFYDTVTKNWSSPIFTTKEACYGTLIYAPEFEVFVSGHIYVSNPELEGKSGQLRVWSMEVDPTTMTEVEVVNGPVRGGQVLTYRVRLTGDDDDPAVDELVDWAVEGVGTLLDPQSRTDAEGYATTQVQYGVQETGDSTVEASVSC